MPALTTPLPSPKGKPQPARAVKTNPLICSHCGLSKKGHPGPTGDRCLVPRYWPLGDLPRMHSILYVCTVMVGFLKPFILRKSLYWLLSEINDWLRTKWLFSFGSFFEYGTAMSFNLDITFTFFNFHSKYLETWSSLDPPLAQLTWEDKRILRWGKGGLGECQELDLEIFQVSGCSWRSGQELCALQALPWRWPEKERFDCLFVC